ncbi:MAG: DUF389 domain-containing protein [Pirellulaceae bacterium]
MRQLMIQVPRGLGARVLDKARTLEDRNGACIEARGSNGPVDWVIVHVSNDRVEALLGGLEDIPALHVTLAPRGFLVLTPPSHAASEQVVDVAFRSPIEIFLGGLQTVGSWKGFLGYAAAGGVVTWIGLFTNTVYILIAAMLIAPFAEPAMSLALATARGDVVLLGRTVLRYFASLSVAVLIAWLCSALFGQQVASEQMVRASLISSVAIFLPMVAGAAGALNLAQSERSSLVSGAAAGALVAASLAPPAGTMGMAAALGQWTMVKSSLFVLLLQLAGINLSGALMFRLLGLTPQGVRYQRGRDWVSWSAWGGTLLLLGTLLAWQFWATPALQHETVSQRATAVVHDVVEKSGLAQVVEADLRFTRADIPGPDTLLAVVYVQRRQAVNVNAQNVQQQLCHMIKAELESHDFNVTPLVHVVVLTQ